MASAYLVQQAAGAVGQRQMGIDTVVVYADSTAQAIAMAKAMCKDADGMWAGATVTAIAADTEVEGWTFGVILSDPVTPFTSVAVEVVGTNAQVIDDIGTALAAALNAEADLEIAGAAYNTGTNVLTIAETTDGMGDWHVAPYVKPPAGSLFEDAEKSVSGVFGSPTHQGSSGAALASTLVATLPKGYFKGRSV